MKVDNKVERYLSDEEAQKLIAVLTDRPKPSRHIPPSSPGHQEFASATST